MKIFIHSAHCKVNQIAFIVNVQGKKNRNLSWGQHADAIYKSSGMNAESLLDERSVSLRSQKQVELSKFNLLNPFVLMTKKQKLHLYFIV